MYFLTLIITDLFTTTWIYLHIIDWFESVIDRQGTFTLKDYGFILKMKSIGQPW